MRMLAIDVVMASLCQKLRKASGLLARAKREAYDQRLSRNKCLFLERERERVSTYTALNESKSSFFPAPCFRFVSFRSVNC